MKWILILCLMAFIPSINAQVGAAEKAVKRAERKVTNKMFEKTFNGVVDKLFGSDSTNVTKDKSVKTDSSVTTNNTRFGGIFSAKTVDKTYRFDVTLDVEIQTKDKKGNGDPLAVQMHYSKDSAYLASEMESAFSIMDFSSMKSYTLIGGNLTTIDLQKMIEKANRYEKDESQDSTATYRKTGKTEVIAGYKCEEYLMEAEDMIGSFWIAQDLGISIKAYEKTFDINPKMNYPEDAQGIMLRMTLENTKEKTVTTMITKEVIKQELTYDLSKYKVTDLSRFGF